MGEDFAGVRLDIDTENLEAPVVVESLVDALN